MKINNNEWQTFNQDCRDNATIDGKENDIIIINNIPYKIDMIVEANNSSFVLCEEYRIDNKSDEVKTLIINNETQKIISKILLRAIQIISEHIEIAKDGKNIKKELDELEILLR